MFFGCGQDRQLPPMDAQRNDLELYPRYIANLGSLRHGTALQDILGGCVGI